MNFVLGVSGDRIAPVVLVAKEREKLPVEPDRKRQHEQRGDELFLHSL